MTTTPKSCTVTSLIKNDQYWGEFPEEKLKTMTEILVIEGLEAARSFAESLGREDFIFGQARSNFIHYLDLTSESVVLDCGAGLGVHTFNMAKVAKEVHSFDQSLSRMQFCAERAKAEGVKNVHFYHSDFAHLPFEENTFDAITMNGVVEWLGEINAHKDPREDQLAVLRQLRRLLKPGGILYIGIENRIAPAYLKGYDHSGLRFTNFYPRWLADRVTKKKKGKSYRTYTYTKRGYDRLLAESGFSSPTLTYYIAYPSYNLPQYIIPYDDRAALSFFVRTLGSEKGAMGVLARGLLRMPYGWLLLRETFFAYAIFAQKES